MGHPSAAYDLPPAEQARLLGWLFARTEKQQAAGKDAAPKPNGRQQVKMADLFPKQR